MDAGNPLISNPEATTESTLEKTHSRECTPNPEVKIQTPSEVSLSINDEPGVTSLLGSPDDDTQSENGQHKCLRTPSRAHSEQLLSSSPNVARKETDHMDSQSWHERSKCKIKWGQGSLDTDLKSEGFNEKVSYLPPYRIIICVFMERKWLFCWEEIRQNTRYFNINSIHFSHTMLSVILFTYM